MIKINREEIVNSDQSPKRTIFNPVHDGGVDGIDPPRQNAGKKQHQDPAGNGLKEPLSPIRIG